MQAIEVDQLTKVYPPDIRAVDGVSFSVREGEVYGFLGPNGAGKTTTIKMILTLTKPNSGSVRVYGVDALRSPANARQMMSYVPQDISADGDLSGYENLLIFSKLYFVSKKDRQERIGAALEYMGLTDRASDLVKHYSGGMMRRLEIAQALVNRPRILILDEPSIGLDPAARREVWRHIKRVNEEFNTTVFITTHDMLEADELCNRIAIINAGKVVATGSPSDLKKSIGEDVIQIKVSSSINHITLPSELGTITSSDNGIVSVLARDGERAIPRILRVFEEAGEPVDSISLSKPSLDDVFLKYAKVRIAEAESVSQSRSVRRSFRRHAR
jgi:ABC-2 type transport system ATP-binding protein